MRNWINILVFILIAFSSCERDLNISEEQSKSYMKFFGGPYDDEAKDILSLEDGGAVILGTITTSIGSQIFIARTDIYGNALWTDTLGLELVNYAAGIEQLPDGSFIVVGNQVNNSTDSDILMINLSVDGNVLWTRIIDTDYYHFVNDVLFSSDNTLILSGYMSYSTNESSNREMLVLKSDFEANKIWERRITGTSYYDEVFEVQEVADYGYIFVATSEFPGYRKQGQDNSNIIITKLNYDGIIMDYVSYGSAGNDIGRSIKALDNGEVLVLGYTNSIGNGSNDFYLLKLSPDIRVPVWEKTYGNITSDLGVYIGAAPDNNFYLIGKTNSGSANPNVLLIKVDILGDEIFQKNFGYQEDDDGVKLVSTADGGILILGSTLFEENRMISLLKVSSDGEL